MVEQASHLDIGGATVALTNILVIFLALRTAQVMTNKNKNENHQPPTFCEQKEKLEKKLPWSKGHQFYRCVHFSILDLNNYL